MTGKRNFDISEWMLLRLIELLDGRHAALAMLCKTSVARKVLKHAWKQSVGIKRAAYFGIDAAAAFGASVDACLLFCEFLPSTSLQMAEVYTELESEDPVQVVGYRDSQLIADIECYERWKHLNSESRYQWHSGIKHDCSRVMELRQLDGRWQNGFGEVVEIE